MKTILAGMLLMASVALIASEIHPFKLSEVSLLDSEFKHAEELGKEYLLDHDPDRLLAPYMLSAGLEAKAERYGNWENTGLDGHIGGHYLTALAQMYVATKDQEILDRLNYMIDELKRCQDHVGTGYLGGVPNGIAMWEEIRQGNIRAGSFSLNGRWVPLYNIHKIFAGLRDAYLIAGNETAKEMLIKLTDWNLELVKKLSDEQIQDMLRSEHGGMNEVFADVAAITGDDKYLELAKKYSHHYLLDPLLKHEDKLNGMHANTQIPKVIGFQRIAEVEGNDAWHDASVFFWETVVQKRSVSIGGNSVSEHFHPETNFSSMVESKEGPESCNTYNMMRLSRQFYFADEDLKYIDYYERALYNHILSTQHPEHGGLVYFTSMRPRHYRVYSKAEEAMWCCVGSGMENHGKYTELIYAHDDNALYVNLFIPSKVNWTDKKVTLTQETNFPNEGKTTFKVETQKAQKFDLAIRYPGWSEKESVKVWVNGKEEKVTAQPGEYLVVNRKWKNNDKVVVELPMTLRREQLPDNSNYVSLLYGPIVLAAATDTTDLDGLIADGSRMGHVANGVYYSLEDAPTIIADNLNAITIEEVEGEELVFKIKNKVIPEKYSNLTLQPFYRTHDTRYEVYFPFASEADLEAEREAIKKKEAERLALEKITIDRVATGEQQPETEHNFKAERSENGVHRDRHWRHAAGWFSYELKDPNKEAKKLRVTYAGEDQGRKFSILVDGKVLAEINPSVYKGAVFYDVEYEIPAEWVANSNGKMEVKFQAKPGSIAGGVYEVRLLNE